MFIDCLANRYIQYICDIIKTENVSSLVLGKSVYLLVVDYSELWEYFYVQQ